MRRALAVLLLAALELAAGPACAQYVGGPLRGSLGGLGRAQPTCSAGQLITCNGVYCSCATLSGAGVDLSAYLTTASAASTYATLAGLSSYLTSSTAGSTYVTLASAGQPGGYAYLNQPDGVLSATWFPDLSATYLRVDTASTTYAPIVQPYDVSVSYPGKPGDAALLAKFKIVRALSFPSGCTGSAIDVGTNPASAWVVTVKKNGSSVGSVSISTSGVGTWTCASPVSLAAGDVLSFVNQATADTTGADLSITYTGTR